MISRATTVAVACILVAGACGIGRERATPAEATLKRLNGTWSVRYHLATPAAGRKLGNVHDVSGAIALLSDGRRRSVPQLDDLTHVGTYDVDFRPFGFDPQDEHEVPRAVGRVSDDDSVQVVLDPGETQTPVVMRGAWVGDSIIGEWTLLVPGRGWGGGAGGAFVMVRGQP